MNFTLVVKDLLATYSWRRKGFRCLTFQFSVCDSVYFFIIFSHICCYGPYFCQ